MNIVKVLLLFAFVCTQTFTANAQHQKDSSLCDSLANLLNYFHENTNDTTFKQALKKAEILCAKNTLTDSLAHALIDAENLLIHLREDSLIVNRYPFKEKIIFGLGNTVVNLLQFLLPQKENLYYAAALNNLGLFYQ
jgi:hypothetical protein